MKYEENNTSNDQSDIFQPKYAEIRNPSYNISHSVSLYELNIFYVEISDTLCLSHMWQDCGKCLNIFRDQYDVIYLIQRDVMYMV